MVTEDDDADNGDGESQSEDEDYTNEETIDEQDELVTHHAMVKTRQAAKQKKIKLKLSLDPTDDTEEDTLFKTKHAACVSKVLGNIDKMLEFDTLHYQLKSTKKPSKALRQTHNKLLAELQLLIQAQKNNY